MMGQNNIISTKRRTTTNGKETYPDAYTIQGEGVYIEQASAEIASSYADIPAYYIYTLITDSILDIKVADLVIDQNGENYSVASVNRLMGNTDVPNHMEVVLKMKYNNAE